MSQGEVLMRKLPRLSSPSPSPGGHKGEGKAKAPAFLILRCERLVTLEPTGEVAFGIPPSPRGLIAVPLVKNFTQSYESGRRAVGLYSGRKRLFKSRTRVSQTKSLAP